MEMGVFFMVVVKSGIVERLISVVDKCGDEINRIAKEISDFLSEFVSQRIDW